MKRKPRLTWLYALIVLCLLFSATAVWTLADKLTKQRESAQMYAQLSSEVVVSGATVFSDASPTPELTETGSEAENVDQNDTLFYLENDVVGLSALDTATAEPSQTPSASLATQATATPTTSLQTPNLNETPGEGWTLKTAEPGTTATEPAATVGATAAPTAKETPKPVTTASSKPAAQTAATAAPNAAATLEPQSTSQGAVMSGGWLYIQPTAAPSAKTAASPTASPAGTAATPAKETPSVTEPATQTPASGATPGNPLAAATAAVSVTPSATVQATPEEYETNTPTTETPPSPSPSAPSTPLNTQSPSPTPSPVITATPSPTDISKTRMISMDNVRYSVDFTYLKTLSQDVKAWLIQDNTVINYPVVQGKDNDYYLTHLFNRNLNKDGAIFLDSGSSETFDDANIYIYGHHTKTDSMFSTLSYYKDQAYYEAHPQMILLTPYADYCIDLFAAAVFDAADETSWRVKQFLRKSEFDAYIQQLENSSIFKAKPESMPEWGDQLMVLVTCTNDRHGERYVVYGRMRQIVYSETQNVTVTKMAMDAKATLTQWENVPGRGKMLVYAQNDPLWGRMGYENRNSITRRTFGAGGCGPTSVAMAVANLVPKERLPDIFGYAKSSLGYTFSESSVNQYGSGKTQAQYQIQTVDEYLRYLPLVMANFATGNNLWGEVSRSNTSGTSLRFLKRIAFLYKLDLSYTNDENAAIEAVRKGALAVCSLGQSNPFTGGGHYIVMASADDEYVYFLDPYRQENYDRFDENHVLNTIAPGVAMVKLSDVRYLHIGTNYLLKTTDTTATTDLPVVTQ